MERNALGFLPPNAYRQAAEQGKLFVAVNVTESLASAQATADNYIIASGVAPEDVTRTVTFINVNGAPALQFDISCDFDSMLTSMIPGVPGTLSVSSSVVMRREGAP